VPVEPEPEPEPEPEELLPPTIVAVFTVNVPADVWFEIFSKLTATWAMMFAPTRPELTFRVTGDGRPDAKLIVAGL
jgi:hypothetical protein